MASIKQQALSGIKWNTVSKITRDLLSVVQLMIVARYIDKADFGTMSIIHVVMGMVGMFTDLGMYAAIMHKQNITNNQYNSLYWFNWFLNIFIFLIVCCIAYPVSLFYKDDRLIYLICLVSIRILLSPFGKIFVTLKQKNLEFSFISKVALFLNVLGFILTILFSVLNFKIYALILPSLITGTVGALIWSVAGRKYFRVRFHYNFSEIKDFFKIGIYDTGAQLMDYLSYKIDVLLIGRFFGLEVLGLYNMGKELAMKVMKMINPIINSVTTPILAKLQNEPEKIKRNYSRILSLLTSVNFPVLFALFVFAESVVNIFFSDKYAEAAIFVRILSIWGIFATIGNPAGNLVIAKGRTDLSFKWTILRFCIAPIAIYIASFFNVVAVAYSQVLLQIFFFFIYWKMMIYPLSDLNLCEYIGSFSKPFICSVIAIIPTFVYANYVTLPVELIYLIFGCVIFSVLYLISTWFINKPIIDFLTSLYKK